MRLIKGLFCTRCNRYELAHLMYCPICLENYGTQKVFLDVRDNMVIADLNPVSGEKIIRNLPIVNQQLTQELRMLGARGSIEIPVKVLSAMWGFNNKWEWVLETVFAEYIRWY